jgi:hypothetical protein
MYVKKFIFRDRSISLSMSLLELFLGFLGCARSAERSTRNSISGTRSVHLNLESRSVEKVLGWHTRRIHGPKGETSRLLNTLEERLRRGRHKETELLRIL